MNSEPKYIQAVKDVLLDEFSSPSMEFIRFFANRVCSSIPGQRIIDELGPIVKEAFNQFINDHINDPVKPVIQSKELAENLAGRSDHHIISDEEFEGFFVVNVAEKDSFEKLGHNQLS